MHHDMTQTAHSGSPFYAFVNGVLYLVAFTSNVAVTTVNFEKVYDYSFKILSLISVVLIIIINWNKAWHVIKDSFKSKSKEDGTN